MAKDCWAEGGGQERQGPKGWKGPNQAGHTHQAHKDTLSYMACNNSHQISQYNWILDSATTSHICTICDAFIDYIPLKDSTIKGLGDPVMAHRHRTVLVNFTINRKMIHHQLHDVLHVPDANLMHQIVYYLSLISMRHRDMWRCKEENAQ